MKIGIANDHAGVEYKNTIKNFLEENGHKVYNYGTDSEDSFDYPLAAKELAKHIKKNDCELGIAICGTGAGISMACNKVNGIRAACCSEEMTAHLMREHNNANIVCIGARIVTIDKALEIVNEFINTSFSAEERHIRRIDEIEEIEKEN